MVARMRFVLLKRLSIVRRVRDCGGGLGPSTASITCNITERPAPTQETPRAPAGLEHSVIVLCRLGDRLNDIPVLNHLAVVQAEDVDDGKAACAGFTHRIHVHDDKIPVGEDALDLTLVVRELLFEKTDKALQTFGPVLRSGIVLPVLGSEIFRGLVKILLVQSGVVERPYGFLVLLELCGIRGPSGMRPDSGHENRNHKRAKTYHGDLPLTLQRDLDRTTRADYSTPARANISFASGVPRKRTNDSPPSDRGAGAAA